MSQKIVHVVYSGLGGHANVLFPLLEDVSMNHFEHVVVFFGIEKVLPNYLNMAKELGVKTYVIHKKVRSYRKPFLEFKKILKKEMQP